MTKFFTKSALFLCIALIVGASTETSAYADGGVQTAYFEAAIGKSRFTIKLQGRRPIKEARQIIRSKSSAMVLGRVVASAASYNPKWAFHLEPKSIRFAEMAIGTCDASPQFVQKNLKQLGADFLPGKIWCPWQSVLVKEIKR